MPSQLGDRVRLYGLCALLLVCAAPTDVLVNGAFRWSPLCTRVAWAGLLFACSQLERIRHRLIPQGVILWIAAVSSVPFYAALVAFTGGEASPYFDLWPSLPLLMAFFLRERWAPMALVGALSTLFVAAEVLRSTGLGMQFAGEVGTLAAAAAGSLLLGRYLGRVQRMEAQILAERERREHLERLAFAERRRRQSEKLALVGQLTSSIVHELKNPVAGIRSNIEFALSALRRARPSSEVAEALADVEAGLDQVEQIVNDVRQFSRSDSDEGSCCEPAAAVADALRLASLRLHRGRVDVHFPTHLPAVVADGRKLCQVLLNLLVNAADAMEERPAGKVHIRGEASASEVRIHVEDDGPGIPQPVLARLFEPFFTTKGPDKGTGLGLALSREFLKQFGGSLEAANRAEGGARFTVVLRVAELAPIRKSA